MPPRKRKPTGPTPVEAITHGDKRVNIPTADAADAYGFEAPVQQVVYPRRPELDPQLVWRGKDAQDAVDLFVDAPPIYQQERIDPRVLVENLRATAKVGEDEPELTLFDTFEGLDELDAVDFYQHAANWSNRMILGDSLQVMASLAEREALRGQVQMVYLDPPYGIKFGSNWQVSARKRDVKDGKLEDAAREAEQIKAFRDTWELGIHSYLSYLRDRLVVARDLLTESGSVFVQIGDENVHLVRSLLDEVFGAENFVSLIGFRKVAAVSSPSARLNALGSTVDYAIWFAKDLDRLKYRQLFLPKDLLGSGAGEYRFIDEEGVRRQFSAEEKADPSKLPSSARVYRQDNLTSSGFSPELSMPFRYEGREYALKGSIHWKTTRSGLERLATANRLERRGVSLAYVRYLDDFPVIPMVNVWQDTSWGFGEDKSYVVQTASKVVQRCMLMCTDPGDLVIDPTCGSGTTAFVAEQWGRRWITIDTSRVALALARQRLMGAKYPYYLLADSTEGRAKEEQVSAKPLPPAEMTNDIRHGFVYERVQHVTLKSIANNPDIVEGMSRDEIDAAIKRHADFEVLYDRPYEDKGKVRVAGPFTVESLSPHRSVAFEATPEAEAARISQAEQSAETSAEGASFEQSILANLQKAGIQNGRRNERIRFASLDTYAGTHLQAIGERASDDEADASESAEGASRIGIAIGPQYGTVSPAFIKGAAKEAVAAGDVDLVCVLGFAFDAQATEVADADGVEIETSSEGFGVEAERRVGRVRVLLVRMNVDLLMGEELAKTGAGNLFTVFGEPDLEVRSVDDGRYVVELKGVDVYDPTTGQVRSNDTGQIALWMIDTDYNDEAFFVRHCYFTGGNDPYKRLKTALKAEIDPEAWESLYATTSRPFDKPSAGRIAVKVINDYGDEVMKVFEVA